MVAFTKPTKKDIAPKPVGLFDYRGQQQAFKNARRRQYDTRAPGSKDYKPAKDPNEAPAYMKAVKPRKAGLMNKDVFKNNTISTSPYGKQDLAGKGRKAGMYGDVRQITEDTKYGGMQKKGNELKTPKKKTKKKESSSVKHRSQTQMNSARKSMGQGRYNFTK